MKRMSFYRRGKATAALLLSLFFAPQLHAQNVDFSWAGAFIGANTVTLNATVADAHGNIYVGGSFLDSVDFDPSAGTHYLHSPEYTDGFICKLNPTGQLEWAIQLRGQWETELFGLTTDTSGNVYAIGQFYDSLDIDPGVDSSFIYAPGSNNGYVLKFDSLGNNIWAVPFGGLYFNTALDIVVDDLEQVYITGRFQGSCDFGPHNLYTTSNNTNIFTAKLSSTGQFLWAKQMGSPSSSLDCGNAICLDDAGNIFTAGYFKNTADFNIGGTAASLVAVGNNDAFFCKHDNNGNFQWVKQISGAAWESINAIGIDAYGYLYASGDFDGSTDFDPSVAQNNLSPAGSNDYFIAKYSSTGDLVFAQSYGSTSTDLLRSMYVSNHGEIFLSGIFSLSVDFDPDSTQETTLTSLGFTDTFIQKLDSSGHFQWVKQIGGASSEESRQLYCDANGNVLLGGIFSGTTDFDPGAGFFQLTASAMPNSFVIKLSPESIPTAFSVLSDEEISLFPNPSSGIFSIDCTNLGNQPIHIEAFNTSGQLISSQYFESGHIINLDWSGFCSGMYYLIITSNNQVFGNKVLLETTK